MRGRSRWVRNTFKSTTRRPTGGGGRRHSLRVYHTNPIITLTRRSRKASWYFSECVAKLVISTQPDTGATRRRPSPAPNPTPAPELPLSAVRNRHRSDSGVGSSREACFKAIEEANSVVGTDAEDEVTEDEAPEDENEEDENEEDEAAGEAVAALQRRGRSSKSEARRSTAGGLPRNARSSTLACEPPAVI